MSDRVALDPGDVEDLAEFLSFLADLTDFDGRRLATALDGFTGWGYGLDDLRADLDRFVTLLGGRPLIFGRRASREELRPVPFTGSP